MQKGEEAPISRSTAAGGSSYLGCPGSQSSSSTRMGTVQRTKVGVWDWKTGFQKAT